MSDTNRKTNLLLHVSPGTARSQIIGFKDEILRVKIAASPEKGKANEALIDFLSKLLLISKSRLQIVKGHTSRRKLLAIEGMTLSEIRLRLTSGN